MKILKGSLLILAFTASMSAADSHETSKVAEPQIVARVNGEAVTVAEFQRMRANPYVQQQAQQERSTKNPDAKELDRLALRKLIHRRLMLQEANRRNISVDDKELDQAIAALRQRFNDLKEFGTWMKQQDLDDKSLFENIRANMLTDRVSAALAEGVRPSNEAVQQYYETYKDELKKEEVRLQIIVVKDKATAEEVLTAALKKREDFGRLAQQYSAGRRAMHGGDTGWVESETLWPPLRAAVATLKEGEATGPLERQSEFLLLRLHARRLGRMRTFIESQPEIERRLLPATRQREIQSWLIEQEQKAKIEVFLPTGRPKEVNAITNDTTEQHGGSGHEQGGGK
jgi:parvulin-like peptidyl-prolyl isomerase